MAFIEDTFTDSNSTLVTDHTGDSGVTWSEHPTFSKNSTANWIITNNRATASNSSAGVVLASAVPTADKYDIAFDLYTHVNVGHTGIVFCADASLANGYRVMYGDNNPVRGWELDRMDNDVYTLLDRTIVAVTTSTTYAVLVEVRGTTYTMYVDGAEVASATDATYTSGAVGLYQVGTSGLHIDNLVVTLVSDPPVVDAGTDDTITEGDTFTRTVSFADADSTSWTATVDYGEGAGPVAATVDQVNKTVALSNVYDSAGEYTVTVTVNDGIATGQDTLLVTVAEAPITGRFVVAQVAGTHPTAPRITLP